MVREGGFVDSFSTDLWCWSSLLRVDSSVLMDILPSS